MSKLFPVLLLIVSIFLCQAYSASYREKPNPKRKSDGCYTDQYSLGHLKVGERKSVPGRCQRYSCESNGGIVYASCDELGTHPGYEVSLADLNKSFPECCPQLQRNG